MDILSSIDIMKRQALTEILKNVSVRSDALNKFLKLYIDNGEQSPFALASIVPGFGTVPSSSEFNANIAMTYLDIYALYTLLYSSIGTTSNLSSVSLVKYQAMLREYKRIVKQIKENLYSSEFRYTSFMDFTMNEKTEVGIDVTSTESLVLNMLSITDALSLPVLSREIMLPRQIFVADTMSSSDGVDVRRINASTIVADLHIPHSDKFGVPFSVTQTKTHAAVDHILPDMYGYTKGYVGKSILLKIISVVENPGDENRTLSYIYQTSLDNGVTWSQDNGPTAIDTYTDMALYEGITSGINFKFQYPAKLETDDMWRIDLFYKTHVPAALEFRIFFNTLKDVSYVRYSDVSDYPLKEYAGYEDPLSSNKKPVLLHLTEDSSADRPVAYQMNDRLDNIVQVGSSLYQVGMMFEQRAHTFSQKNETATAKYNFRLSNIKAISDVYASYGNITLAPITVQDITALTMTADMLHNSKQFVYFEAIVENQYGRIGINLPVSDYYINNPGEFMGSYGVFKEPIFMERFISTASGTSNQYPLAHRIYDNLGTSVLEIATNTPVGAVYTHVPSTVNGKNKVSFDVYSNKFYYVKYNAKINSIFDTYVNEIAVNPDPLVVSDWIEIAGLRLAYMLFLDADNRINVAIRTIDYTGGKKILGAFSGKVYVKISMLTGETDVNTSPYVFNYMLNCH